MKFIFCVFSFVILACSSAKRNVGLIGGSDAKAGQFPYAVSVQQCGLFGCDFFCTGSIIAPTWILATGQCYESGYKWKVVAGILKQSEKSSEYMQTVDVNKITVHENWHGEIGQDDIALFNLKEPLVYNERIQPVNLPTKDYTALGAAVVSGWGETGGGDIDPTYPDTMQYINFTIINGHDCKQELDAILVGQDDPFDDSNMICTSDDEGGKSICTGDAASPLVQNNTVVGLTSWGISPCGSPGAPSVFTKVSNYLDWIINHMS